MKKFLITLFVAIIAMGVNAQSEGIEVTLSVASEDDASFHGNNGVWYCERKATLQLTVDMICTADSLSQLLTEKSVIIASSKTDGTAKRIIVDFKPTDAVALQRSTIFLVDNYNLNTDYVMYAYIGDGQEESFRSQSVSFYVVEPRFFNTGKETFELKSGADKELSAEGQGGINWAYSWNGGDFSDKSTYTYSGVYVSSLGTMDERTCKVVARHLLPNGQVWGEYEKDFVLRYYPEGDVEC